MVVTVSTQCLQPNFAKFEDGLLPVVVQSTAGEVLMLAYTNEQAYRLTLKTGEAHYWSRTDPTRQPWHKGATSGNIQNVRRVLVDCDGDALIYEVEQTGVACHTGNRSCFFRDVIADVAQATQPRPEDSLVVTESEVNGSLLPKGVTDGTTA